MKINRNIFYSELLCKLLSDNKIKDYCISPGSRSTPLIFAIANSKKINKFVNLDERSSAFFALGISRNSDKPAVLITTSGTAVAELYPAIIESFYQRIPLIVITADRPEKFRNTGANQTINQNNIFSNHIRYAVDLTCESINETNILKFANHIKKAIKICLNDNRGPVHINIQFDKPFEPDSFTDEIELSKLKNFLIPSFENPKIKERISDQFKSRDNKILIICGPNSYKTNELKAILNISKLLKAPIFADGASNLRKFNYKNIISNFNSILASKTIFSEPDIILSFGLPPTSVFLQNYFEKSLAKKIVVNEFGDINDPSKTFTKILNLSPINLDNLILKNSYNSTDNYLSELKKLNTFFEKTKIDFINKFSKIESSLTYSVINNLPANSNLIVANSTLIRDVDYFVSLHKNIDIYTLRGASGIDGNISYALGILAKSEKTTTLLIGDLSFLYDINALLIANNYNLPLNIILLNNNGGGIFNNLPIAKFKNICEDYFIAKQNVNIEEIAKAYKSKYYDLSDTQIFNNLDSLIDNNKKAIQVFEIKTDSIESTKVKKSYWESLKVL